MKRYIIVAIAFAFLVVGAFVTVSRHQTRLTILLNGVPAANLSVTDFQTMSPQNLDSTGSVTFDHDTSKPNAVLITMGNGNKRLVSLPENGHKTVDLRSRLVITRTVKYEFGFIPREEITEQYEPTDAEIAAIEAGEVTMSEVEESIRKETEE